MWVGFYWANKRAQGTIAGLSMGGGHTLAASGNYPGTLILEELLKRNGLEHTMYINGGGHVWSNWRNYLREIAPKLFK